ncbi:MAG: ribonuclease HII [Conexivisphaera sp.]
MRIAGLDEAGRGSLLGPLAVAVVAVRAEDQPRLLEMGAKDSKKLSPRTRRRVARDISRSADVRALLIPHWTVDSSTRARGGNLNSLEAAAFAKLICDARPDVAIVDAPDPRPARFGALVEDLARSAGCHVRIVARHHADASYVIVGAASVIAKVTRDDAIIEYSSRYGSIGSGYPHDRRTLEFVSQWRLRWGDYPYIVRREWSTLKVDPA